MSDPRRIRRLVIDRRYYLSSRAEEKMWADWLERPNIGRVLFVANFLHEPQNGYFIGFPAPGPWKLSFNSGFQGYSDDSVIRAPTWSPNRAHTTTCPSTRRCPVAPRAC